jgi:acyl-CoA reductase-like NAD-dependent aldehyde dehydrogenase
MINALLLIGGNEQSAVSGETFDVLSPCTEKVIGKAARADARDVDLAVKSARAGFIDWSNVSPYQRELVLLRAADIVEREGESRFLDLLINESGAVVTKAHFEISKTADFLRAAAGEVRRLYGDTLPNEDINRLSMVFREPLGVVATIIPYNAPLLLLAKMTAYPIAAGNSVVIKPSEETPIIAIEYAKLLIEAGLPKDTINVVTGFGDECGSPLVSHPGIDSVALTGSTTTGKIVGKLAMERMRPVQLELGGKSALLVLDDFDPQQAAQKAVMGMFYHAGQICMANSRIIVEAGIYDAFLEALKEACEDLVIGNVTDPLSFYGPVINRRALEKIQAHIADALLNGATILTGGNIQSGLTLQPTIILEPPTTSSIWKDESFGPLASVVRANDLEHAISIANDSVFGLSAGVLTHDIKRGFKAARKIQSGAVHIGDNAFQSNALAPIGGYGESGLGSSGGHYSTEEFTQMKWISVNLND